MAHLAEPVGCNTVGAMSFMLGLLGGTICSIIMKIIYEMTAEDTAGVIQHFEKPLFLTALMFMAMACALPAFLVQQALKHPEKRAPTVPTRVLLWLFIPAIFDLVGTMFAQTGLVFTTVSYFQLLRCTVVVVTAFLKAFVLMQKLASYMWWGVAINIVAMFLVSATSFFAPKDDQPGGRDNPALGTIFILLSCLVQGSQYIFEEKVMAVDNAPPLVVIGMEGLWGTLVMMMVLPIASMLPGGDSGSLESTRDTLHMIAGSDAIKTLLFVFFVTVTIYNVFCIYVTAYLSAIWHAILDNFRPISVWTADLAIYYILTGGKFGEGWTDFSWLQLGGMIVLFIGTAVYNGTLRIPFIAYEEEGHTAGMRTPDELASPSLMHSPLLRRLSSEYDSATKCAKRAGQPEMDVLSAVEEGRGKGVNVLNGARGTTSERQTLLSVKGKGEEGYMSVAREV